MGVIKAMLEMKAFADNLSCFYWNRHVNGSNMLVIHVLFLSDMLLLRVHEE